MSEDWPTDGWPGAAYTREKAYLERVLDVFERDNPETRVVRIRPAFVFKQEAASEHRRFFSARAVLAAAWHAHLVPASPGLFDAVRQLPLMDTTRARVELGWAPRFTATDALEEFIDGLREGSGLHTPRLEPVTPGGRAQEFATGVGERP